MPTKGIRAEVNVFMNREELKTQLSQLVSDRVYIYGCGVVAKRLYDVFISMHLDDCICGFIVSKLLVSDENAYMGKPVFEIEECEDKNAHIILAVSDAYQNEILHLLRKKGFFNVTNGYLYSFINNEYIPDNIPIVVPDKISMDINELMSMQFDEGRFLGYDMLISLLEDFSLEYERCTEVYDTDVILDRDMRVVCGRNMVAKLLRENAKRIHVLQRFDMAAQEYDRKWVCQAYEAEKLADLDEKLYEYKNQWIRPFLGIVWPNAFVYSDEIINDFRIGKDIRIGGVWKISFPREQFKNFVKRLYKTDDMEDWKIEKKIERMLLVDELNISVFEFYLDNPKFRIKRYGHTISDTGMKIKNTIRMKYRMVIPDYIEDIVLHTVDNYEQSEKAIQLVHEVIGIQV